MEDGLSRAGLTQTGNATKSVVMHRKSLGLLVAAATACGDAESQMPQMVGPESSFEAQLDGTPEIPAPQSGFWFMGPSPDIADIKVILSDLPDACDQLTALARAEIEAFEARTPQALEQLETQGTDIVPERYWTLDFTFIAATTAELESAVFEFGERANLFVIHQDGRADWTALLEGGGEAALNRMGWMADGATVTVDAFDVTGAMSAHGQAPLVTDIAELMNGQIDFSFTVEPCPEHEAPFRERLQYF